jgi:hypothetical protein
LTLPKPTGLINFKPRGRKRGRLHRKRAQMVETLQSPSDRNAFAPSLPRTRGSEGAAGRVLWVLVSKNKNALGR